MGWFIHTLPSDDTKQLTMPHALGDMDWNIIQDWIQEISTENITSLFRERFLTLTIPLVKTYLYANESTIPKQKYQAYTLACMYITSCYACHHPIGIDELHDWCAFCYTKDALVQAVYVVVHWMHQNENGHVEVAYIKTLQICEASICDKVRSTADDSHLMVRKRIYHGEHLPAYEAMVEVVTHYILKTTCDYTNIARLVQLQISDKSVDLFYEYVPAPLYRYFGHTDRNLAQTLIMSLLRGVYCLHAQGISHRDLKGTNIHVDTKNECMLLDLGAAGCSGVRVTVPVCTMTHRSPDILQAEIDDRSYVYDGKCLDMWSIGVLIAEIHLGSAPFGHIDKGTSALKMLRRIHRKKDSVLSSLRGTTCTAAQVAMVDQCLDDFPGCRPRIGEVMAVFDTHIFDTDMHLGC